MSTKRTLAIGLLTFIGCAGLGSAGGVDQRQYNQRHRIGQGIASGELTRRETARLATEQAWIRAEERRYRCSGAGLGPLERLDLQRDLNRASRDIYRQKHDRQHAQ
jgi:hypothetical protein